MTTQTLDELRGSDYIYSSDIIDRIDQLDALDDRDELETEELAALRAFAEEASGYFPDWRYGETLIRDDMFEDHARELAEDIGAIAHDAPWPASYIDWRAAADALKMDYTSIEFQGYTYWAR